MGGHGSRPRDDPPGRPRQLHQAAFFSELFGTRVRYSGASLGYQLASPLAGGVAPLIAAALVKAAGGSSWLAALYLVAMSALTLLSVWLAQETSKTDLS